MSDVGLGVDLGSTELRVALFELETDKLLDVVIEGVPYTNHGKNVITQSTFDVIAAAKKVKQRLAFSSANMRSLGVAATCSMVVSQNVDGELIPLSVCRNDDNKCEDIIFWMHSAATEEASFLNKNISTEFLDHLGGNFIAEMEVPKLIQLSKNNSDRELVVLDLHHWLLKMMSELFDFTPFKPVNKPNTNGIAHDGELYGWNKTFYDQLNIPNVTIGYNAEQVSTRNELFPGDSCIDCYASWFTTFDKKLANETLFAVAGTSTCFLHASSEHSGSIPGVWGPFTNILNNRNHNGEEDKFSVFQAGISTSGKLIEHLFDTHPAAKKYGHEIITAIEAEILKIEKVTGKSIHLSAKHVFMYGDLNGNRTPYLDDDMRGVFIGESTDTSFIDLVLKYVAVLETLAFQIKSVVVAFDSSRNTNIKRILITGGQANNSRLLGLVKTINKDQQVEKVAGDVSLTGLKGAYLLGKAKYYKTGFESVLEYNKVEKITINVPSDIDTNVGKLLDAKYEIYKDMAVTQRRYRDYINNILK